MEATEQKLSAMGWFYVVSATLSRLGAFVAVLALARLGVVLLQANLQHETVATVERAWVSGSACVASSLPLYKLLHAQRLKGLSDEEIAAEHDKQCAGKSTSGANVTLQLAWNDHEMKEHKTSVMVSQTMADRMIVSGRLQRDAVRVRYNPSSPDVSLVLMEEIENSRQESVLMLAGALIVTLLGLAGSYWHRVRLRAVQANAITSSQGNLN